MERYRDRLLTLESPHELSRLSQELSSLELGERLSLPFYVVSSVLAEAYSRVSGRPLGTATWRQLQERLIDTIAPVIDAHVAGDRARLFDSLNDLTRQWAYVRQELLR